MAFNTQRRASSKAGFFIVTLLIAALIMTWIGISYYVAGAFIKPYKPSGVEKDKVEKRRHWLDEQKVTTIDFFNKKNQLLKGLFLERPQAPYTLLVCHGYNRVKENSWEVAHYFLKPSIFYFDFHAHGESQGDSISIGWDEREDIHAALKKVRTLIPPGHPVIGLGFSMGAAALVGAAAQGAQCEALIIDSSFDTLAKEIQRVFVKKTGLPEIPFLWMSKNIFRILIGAWMEDINIVQWAHAVTTPTLVIHSRSDDFTPFECSQEIFNALAGVKKEWFSNGPPHAMVIHSYPQQYVETVEEFLHQNAIT